MESIPLKSRTESERGTELNGAASLKYMDKSSKLGLFFYRDNKKSILKKNILKIVLVFLAGFFFARFFSAWEYNSNSKSNSIDKSYIVDNTNTDTDVIATTMEDPITNLQELENVDLDIKETVNAQLTMSIQKTGTTAVEWIAQAIFKNFAAEVEDGIVKFNKYETAPNVINKDKFHQINWKGKHVIFDVHGKHDNSKVTPNIPVRVKIAASQCVQNNIPAFTNACAKYIGGLRHFTNSSKTMKHEKQNKYFTTFRNPIATIISWIHYESPGLGTNKEKLSETLLTTDKCARAAANMALVHRMVTEILPGLGYQIYPLYFDEMRLYPHEFVRKFAAQLELTIDENIVRKVVEQTSPEHMKAIQEDLKHAGEHYSGLSQNGKNSRKVRSADVRGYLKELTPEALKKCMKDAAFHLPPALKERYGFV
uniref:Sulfotransferase domain-containing protein n=1 Tax=Aplanochytrium stocchinoi TaxID=215587 RepID=A0A7S3PHQ3_9STRA|mmetsp:Transcript_13867/g.16087  ORF Transcript_13867/g.16087 Transcript_13867/m.16087 type:complete len:425 (+) Transcript_13867:298-1572(+)